MIISLFERGKPGVRGTINTDGTTPVATGVGKELLNVWLEAQEGAPIADITRSLETFYSSFINPPEAASAEIAVEEIAFTVDEDGSVLELVRSTAEGIFLREGGDWVAPENDSLPTVWGQEWISTDQAGVDYWDSQENSGNLTREQVTEYVVSSS